jgi:hypothetical protein
MEMEISLLSKTMEAVQRTFQTVTSFITPSLGTLIVIGLGLFVFYWVYEKCKVWQRKRAQNRIDRQCQELDPEETIFVSVASYRDPECAETLFDLFEKAYCPFRISVGVCQQNYTSVDEDVMEAYKKLAQKGVGDFSDRIRIIRLDADEAKGPMYARHLIERKLFRGERYYLITDSHMMFTPGWDKRLIDEWKTCAKLSPKPILTMYPDDFKPHHRLLPPLNYDQAKGSYLRFKKFNDKSGLLEIEGPTFMRKPSTPVLSMFWAAGFSFGPSSMIQEVPFDPYCDYVFFGEEVLMAVRLWTSGYDFYHPTTMYCYHMWERNRPTFWQQFSDKANTIHRERQQKETEGYERIKKILNLSPEPVTILPPYGLGQHRTLDQYEQFIGIKMKTQQFTSLSGIMGVMDNASADVILCKFGTWKNFETAKQLLTKTLTGQGNGR